MGLLYRAPFRNITLTANGSSSQDIWELVAPSGVSVVLHGWGVSSQYNVDERIDIALLTRTGTGSGGSAVTPVAANTRNTIASAITSFTTLRTTPGSGGTVIADPYEWSELGPLDILYAPEDRIELSAGGGRLVLNNANAYVASSRVISGYALWEER